jgi:hypothetical protein
MFINYYQYYGHENPRLSSRRNPLRHQHDIDPKNLAHAAPDHRGFVLAEPINLDIDRHIFAMLAGIKRAWNQSALGEWLEQSRQKARIGQSRNRKTGGGSGKINGSRIVGSA